ncbi:hypothetical protein L1987_18863 [Smallanthus sonchifolius]|uniref:Uncharacterized protein n=1 Tax=Smallanthus sonchifolius TaxID=185202 RepID=A0ACB9J1W8_9ASTR|nr:hypothetical protein L1987_18863 [Smallanthus sonchifolius]
MMTVTMGITVILEVVNPTSEASRVWGLTLDDHLEEDEIPQLRIHKDHPTDNITGPLNAGVRTRSATRAMNDSLFSCFISQVEPKNIKTALLENSWLEACKKNCSSSASYTCGIW